MRESYKNQKVVCSNGAYTARAQPVRVRGKPVCREGTASENYIISEDTRGQ